MMIFSRKLFFLVLTLIFLGCESNTSYDINSDEAIKDMNERILSLEEDLKNLNDDLEKVEKVLKDPDIDPELRASVRKEVHLGDQFKKEIDQWISFLKVRRKQRYKSLKERRLSKSLKEQAEAEIRAYFVEKKLKPIKRPWLDRYRTAIEL